MTASSDAVKQRDVQGVSFDPSQFMRSIISNIDGARGDMGPIPNKIVENIITEPVGERVESRVNAFFRLIGLPATRDDSIITRRREDFELNTTESQLSQTSTLNYFAPGSLNINDPSIPGKFLTGNEASRRIVGREQILQKPMKNQTMVDLLNKPLPLDSSILPNVSRRTSLFPLLVDASTPIYPLKKRTAPLFYDGDFILSGASSTRLPRPFLESVIYMRTQVLQSGSTDSMKKDLAKNIKSFVLGNAQPLTSEESDQTGEQFVRSLGLDNLDNPAVDSLSNYNLLELRMINKFVQALRSSAMNYKSAVSSATEFKKRVSFSPEVKDNPAERSGNSTVIVNGLIKGSIDDKIESLESQLSVSNSFISLLPTNEVKRADTSYRAEGDEVVKSIIPDVFISDFTNIVTFDQENILSQLSSAKSQRERDIREYNLIKERIQYFSGETVGLSIFDILCTFLALFTVDIETLIGLLNKDARARLFNSPFYSFQNNAENKGKNKTPIFDQNAVTDRIEAALISSTNSLDVQISLNDLEDKIRENFKLSSAFYNDAIKSSPGSPGVVGVGSRVGR